MNRIFSVLLCLGVVSAMSAGNLQATQYVMHDLGTGYAGHINNKGQIICYDSVNGVSQFYLCNPEDNYSRQNLSTLAGISIESVSCMNNLGQIVVETGSINHNDSHSFLLDPKSGSYSVQDIGTLGGGITDARDINDNGQIVGESETSDNKFQAFLWDPISNQIRDINPDTKNTGSMAIGINNNGQIACSVCIDNNMTYQAYLLDQNSAGSKVQVPGLPGKRSCVATGINDNGQVIGYSTDLLGDPNDMQGFLWDSATNQCQSTSLSMGSYKSYMSYPTTINNKGQVIIGGPNSCLWQNGVLTSFGQDAYIGNINDNGWVTGEAKFSDGTYHAVVWEPVPEPSSILAIICGISGLGGIILRRNR